MVTAGLDVSVGLVGEGTSTVGGGVEKPGVLINENPKGSVVSSVSVGEGVGIVGVVDGNDGLNLFSQLSLSFMNISWTK